MVVVAVSSCQVAVITVPFPFLGLLTRAAMYLAIPSVPYRLSSQPIHLHARQCIWRFPLCPIDQERLWVGMRVPSAEIAEI